MFTLNTHIFTCDSCGQVTEASRNVAKLGWCRKCIVEISRKQFNPRRTG